MKIGEPRYQPTGSITASATAATTAVRPGWRRAAAIQPNRAATNTARTANAIDAMATGIRNSYRARATSLAMSPIDGMARWWMPRVTVV